MYIIFSKLAQMLKQQGIHKANTSKFYLCFKLFVFLNNNNNLFLELKLKLDKFIFLIGVISFFDLN